MKQLCRARIGPAGGILVSLIAAARGLLRDRRNPADTYRTVQVVPNIDAGYPMGHPATCAFPVPSFYGLHASTLFAVHRHSESQPGADAAAVSDVAGGADDGRAGHHRGRRRVRNRPFSRICAGREDGRARAAPTAPSARIGRPQSRRGRGARHPCQLPRFRRYLASGPL